MQSRWGGEAGRDTTAGGVCVRRDGLHTHDFDFRVNPAGIGEVAVTGRNQQIDHQAGAEGEAGAVRFEAYAAAAHVFANGAVDGRRLGVVRGDAILQRQPKGQSLVSAPVCVAHGRPS